MTSHDGQVSAGPKKEDLGSVAKQNVTTELGRTIDFPVVGLGASAGGLEAFRRFFEAAAPDWGMAYILVQHLDPTHDSMMVELLAKRTSMMVQQAVEGMPIQPNQIYVIAPGRYLAIKNGTLHLSTPKEHHGARLPIDFFLYSLAEACGERAVAVILSGTGSDGSLGLKAVHEQGGVVIAQKPEDAAFDGMPRSAITTGCVNLVLPVAEIPEAILVRCRLKLSAPSVTSERRDTDPDTVASHLTEIITVLRNRTTHDFSLYKEGTLLRRIERRMAAAGITDWTGYLDLLREHDGEIELLARDLLINITHFFRDAKAFETLTDLVVADLVQRQPPDRPLRIWVPASSTGEEAYSLAILFTEAITAAKRSIKLQLFASDIDKDAIGIARIGFYPETIASEISPERLARFFIREPSGYRVVSELRGLVVFTVQDVLTDPPFSRLDLISCRNLLIYLRPEAQRRLLLLFHFALSEKGVLFLGGAETVGDLDDRFEPIDKVRRIYRRIGRIRPGEVDFPVGTGADGARTTWSRLPLRPDPQSPNFGDVTRGLVIESYAPASVLINHKHDILYTLGPIDRYLRVPSGEPSQDVFAIVRNGLRTKLRTAVQRADQDQSRIVVTGAVCDRDGESVRVSIDVRPVRNNGEALLLVSFFDEPKPVPSPLASSADDPSRVAALERDLDSTRAELQSAIRNLEIANEEQKAINEEAMSVNEEFQSTNEELETSKEELQSLNEELTALNNQLQETIELQRHLANDLQNILNSSDVATLFLDDKLNIRFFTPAVKLLFGVITTDIGRPLSDLATRFEDPNLLTDARSVLTTDAPKKCEVLSEAGAWLLRHALPYRAHDGRIEGVVITFVDISEIKGVEHDLQTAHAYSESIVDTIHQPLLVLDQTLRVVSANRSFFRVFGLKSEETVGYHFAAGDGTSDSLTGLRAFLERVRAAPAPIEDYEIEIDLPRIGRRSLMVNARNIQNGPPGEPRILLAIDDITERKSATAALETSKQQAEFANLSKSRFLAAASHDLRQPLQTLVLLQGLLARNVTTSIAVDLVTRFDETLTAMSGMLNTLLDINQLEAGIVQAEIASFPINDLLERLRTEFGYHAQSHNLRWHVVGSRAVVRSDPRLLEQIIRNLLANAVKYTLHGGVLLGCRRRGDRLCVEIWDTGPGIPDSQLQAIFEEFYQLDNAARECSKGLGLGLSIVKRLGDMLGHTIGVRSRSGKGSVFSVTIPIVGTMGSSRRLLSNQPTVAAIESQAGKTILVIEDDPAMREMLDILFDAEGYHTRTVADGVLALNMIAQEYLRPDIIVADYNLPGPLNGAQVIERLHQIAGPPCPAIILTGDISVETLQNILRQDCQRLSKPVRTEELMHLVRDMLNQAPRPIASPEDASPTQNATSRPVLGIGESSPLTIFVIDDDTTIRQSMRMLLAANHHTVETYPSAESFLAAWHPDGVCCLLVDAHLPGISGIELIERLAVDGHSVPTIIITGFGDVQMAVRAMKAGAADFIEKPVRADELFSSIDRAITLSRDHTKLAASRNAAAAQIACLTERQRQVMDMVLAGCPSKNIASDLGISQRTVENHRAAIMKKTGSKSLPALARLALGLG